MYSGLVETGCGVLWTGGDRVRCTLVEITAGLQCGVVLSLIQASFSVGST